MGENKHYKIDIQKNRITPFTQNPKDGNLDYNYIVTRISKAFSSLQDFSEGKTSDYSVFDFTGAFDELFFYTRRKSFFTSRNAERISEYLKLIDQITLDYSKSSFKNNKAKENNQFCNDCDVLLYLLMFRKPEFEEFQIIEEFEGEHIHQENNNTKLQILEPKKNEIENPYPLLFVRPEVYSSFIKYTSLYIIDYFIDYSYLKKRLLHDKLIFNITDNEFMEILYNEMYLISEKDYEHYKAEKGKLYSLKKSENENRLNNFNHIF
ncbi:MAG: hypothetical protein JJE44_04425 [Flavobacteriaceae bacterium]|nr:hypothetical protein [Flavobacteriaceae bacterium]